MAIANYRVIESHEDEYTKIEELLDDGMISASDTVWESDSGQIVIASIVDPDDVDGEEFWDRGTVEEFLNA